MNTTLIYHNKNLFNRITAIVSVITSAGTGIYTMYFVDKEGRRFRAQIWHNNEPMARDKALKSVVSSADPLLPEQMRSPFAESVYSRVGQQ